MSILLLDSSKLVHTLRGSSETFNEKKKIGSTYPSTCTFWFDLKFYFLMSHLVPLLETLNFVRGWVTLTKNFEEISSK